MIADSLIICIQSINSQQSTWTMWNWWLHFSNWNIKYSQSKFSHRRWDLQKMLISNENDRRFEKLRSSFDIKILNSEIGILWQDPITMIAWCFNCYCCTEHTVDDERVKCSSFRCSYFTDEIWICEFCENYLIRVSNNWLLLSSIKDFTFYYSTAPAIICDNDHSGDVKKCILTVQ